MTPTDHRARRYLLPFFLTAAVTLAGCAATSDPPSSAGDHTADVSRQREVAERGRSVMPFDLERTTHRFTKTDTGGVQTVVADDPTDATQVTLIQQHLRDETKRFRSGDFADPASIHGIDMPGLAALRDSAGKITIAYGDTGDGARVTFTTADTALVRALHAWFDAQVSDHGSHATAG